MLTWLTSALDALGAFLIVAGVGMLLGTGAAMIVGGVGIIAFSYNIGRSPKS